MAASVISVNGPTTNWGAIALALAPATSTSAITFDASGVGGFGSNTNTHTEAYTCGVAANYLLVGAIGDATSDFITGITYNAVPMTQLLKYYPGSVGWMYFYGLSAPTTGSSQNVVISAGSNCSVIGIVMASYGGVAAVQPNTSTTGSFLTSGIAWTILVPSVPGCWGVQFSRNPLGTLSAVVGAANRVSEVSNGLASLVDTNAIIPVAQSTILTANTTQWQIQRVDVKPRSEETR
jgi:hypothetical protein